MQAAIHYIVFHCLVHVLGGKWWQTRKVGIQLGPLTEQGLDFVFCSVELCLCWPC